MSLPLGNNLEFLQNRFQEDYEGLKAEAVKRAQEAKWRRISAYTFKGIAVFGGISIAAGLHGVWSQVIGILITVAVAIDALFSNHKRLLIVSAAAHAYSNLLDNIKHTHTQKLAEVIKLRQTDQDNARTKLEELLSGLMLQLHNEHQTIETGLKEADLKLLNTISLEQHASDLSTKEQKQ